MFWLLQSDDFNNVLTSVQYMYESDVLRFEFGFVSIFDGFQDFIIVRPYIRTRDSLKVTGRINRVEETRKIFEILENEARKEKREESMWLLTNPRTANAHVEYQSVNNSCLQSETKYFFSSSADRTNNHHVELYHHGIEALLDCKAKFSGGKRTPGTF